MSVSLNTKSTILSYTRSSAPSPPIPPPVSSCAAPASPLFSPDSLLLEPRPPFS
ncbi:hypothetical protein WG66_007674, partial [Moniliophthora roreri]